MKRNAQRILHSIRKYAISAKTYDFLQIKKEIKTIYQLIYTFQSEPRLTTKYAGEMIRSRGFARPDCNQN